MTKTESVTQKTKHYLVHICTDYKPEFIKVLRREDLKILNNASQSLQLFCTFRVYNAVQIISVCSEHSAKSKTKL